MFPRVEEMDRVRATVDNQRRFAICLFASHHEHCPKFVYDDEAVAKQWKDRTESGRLLAAVRDHLTAVAWEAADLERELRALADNLGLGAGKVLQPLRVALVGQAASPGIFDVLVLLGRERSLARVDRALRFLNAPMTPD